MVKWPLPPELCEKGRCILHFPKLSSRPPYLIQSSLLYSSIETGAHTSFWLWKMQYATTLFQKIIVNGELLPKKMLRPHYVPFLNILQLFKTLLKNCQLWSIMFNFVLLKFIQLCSTLLNITNFLDA